MTRYTFALVATFLTLGGTVAKTDATTESTSTPPSSLTQMDRGKAVIAGGWIN